MDYKIFTKLLAVRLQRIIKTIIHENQSGFITGRNISSHIRLIGDIKRFANREQLYGLVVSLDYQKAFDTVEKKTIIAALKCFNFGAQFTKFIETILKKYSKSCEEWRVAVKLVHNQQRCNAGLLR